MDHNYNMGVSCVFLPDYKNDLSITYNFHGGQELKVVELCSITSTRYKKVFIPVMFNSNQCCPTILHNDPEWKLEHSHKPSVHQNR